MATKLSDVKPATPKAAKKPLVSALDPAAMDAPAAAPTELELASSLTVKPVVPVLKVKELVERVSASSGVKKKGLKDIAEALLAEIGAALAEGKELNLPPLGRVRVSRQNGDMMVLKLKRSSGDKAAKKDVTEGVADAED